MNFDFDLTPYKELRDALIAEGILCGFNARHQMTVSFQEGPIWPDQGNSFWMTHATGWWHLFPWYNTGYAIPEATDVAELCRRCMAVGERAMPVVPQDIETEFNLRRLTAEESEQVYSLMKTAG